MFQKNFLVRLKYVESFRNFGKIPETFLKCLFFYEIVENFEISGKLPKIGNGKKYIYIKIIIQTIFQYMETSHPYTARSLHEGLNFIGGKGLLC